MNPARDMKGSKKVQVHKEQKDDYGKYGPDAEWGKGLGEKLYRESQGT